LTSYRSESLYGANVFRKAGEDILDTREHTGTIARESDTHGRWMATLVALGHHPYHSARHRCSGLIVRKADHEQHLGTHGQQIRCLHQDTSTPNAGHEVALYRSRIPQHHGQGPCPGILAHTVHESTVFEMPRIVRTQLLPLRASRFLRLGQRLERLKLTVGKRAGAMCAYQTSHDSA
jgi:hypothetical protein